VPNAQVQLQPQLDGSLAPGAMLRPEADAAAAAHTRPARAELALNPARFESWELYAGALAFVSDGACRLTCAYLSRWR